MDKKIRLFKFATEIDINIADIIKILKAKGYDLKSHMSMLTKEMLNEISQQYTIDPERLKKIKSGSTHSGIKIHEKFQHSITKANILEVLIENVVKESSSNKYLAKMSGRYICNKCGGYKMIVNGHHYKCPNCNIEWYINRCWKCKSIIDSRKNDVVKCRKCSWYICPQCTRCNNYCS